MNITSKQKLILILIFAIFTASTTLADEKAETSQSTEPAPAPKEQKPEIKIEFSISEESKPFLDYEFAQLSIRPSHCARFRVKWEHAVPSMPSIEEILKNPAAAFLSEQQKAFLKTGKAIRETVMSDRAPSNYGEYIYGNSDYYFYGLSQEEVMVTAKVFAELLLLKANADLQPALRDYANRLHDKQKENQDSITIINQQILDKQKEYEIAKKSKEEIERAGRYDSYSLAKEAMLDFNRMLDSIKIETAGIRVKLETIEEYKSVSTSDSYRQKLQEMAIEQTIELNAAEARKKQIYVLWNEAKECLELLRECGKIEMELRDLEDQLKRNKRSISQIEEVFRNGMGMNPVTIEKVGIWPLKVMY